MNDYLVVYAEIDELSNGIDEIYVSADSGLKALYEGASLLGMDTKNCTISDIDLFVDWCFARGYLIKVYNIT